MADLPGCPCSICDEDSGNSGVPLPPEHGNNQNDLRTRIVSALARADQDWCSDRPLYEDMADAVIRELRPQLTEWARLCVQSGGMTPAAQQTLHNILGHDNDQT